MGHEENFKDSFNIWQFLAMVLAFVALLCLAPVLRWLQIFL